MKTITAKEMAMIISEALEDRGGYNFRCESFAEAGVLTYDAGLVVRDRSRNVEFQITVVGGAR